MRAILDGGLGNIFLANHTPMTWNDLRFLVEKIVVFNDRVVIEAKARKRSP